MKPTTDIVEELRLYNRWRRGDEAITAPDPTALGKLLDDAADRIEHLFASGIHTCHADCQRPMCVLRRERDKAHADLARVTAERTQEYNELREACAKRENALRAELDESLHLANGTADLALHHRDIAEQRNAELEAALDDLLGCPTVTDRATCPDGDPSRINEAPEWQAVLQISCAWTRYKRLKALAARK